MLTAYREQSGKLVRLDPGAASLQEALWIDLLSPGEAEVAAVADLGLEVPSLADMEEIEISARLYREAGADYMTVVLPGQGEGTLPVSGPVCFIVAPERLVTVRHQAARPFETYPSRADRAGPGCDRPERVFLGLIEEIVGGLADLLESVGAGLEGVTRLVYRGGAPGPRADMFQTALERVGREGDLLSRVRLSLLTIERALGFFTLTLDQRENGETLRPAITGVTRDVEALAVHADFLGSRLALASDATLGMIDLAQNATVRILSVVAALFLPPTLIASIYGMNFALMPELDWRLGYPAAILLMLASAVVTYLILKWKHWL